MESKCQFLASKIDSEICGNPVDTYHGFCKKHEYTVQARKKMKEQNDKITNGRKIQIMRNEYGRFEHKDSHIIFDMATQKAYGVQGDGGEVFELGEEEIKYCKLNGFGYQIKRKNIEEEIIFDDQVF